MPFPPPPTPLPGALAGAERGEAAALNLPNVPNTISPFRPDLQRALRNLPLPPGTECFVVTPVVRGNRPPAPAPVPLQPRRLEYEEIGAVQNPNYAGPEPGRVAGAPPMPPPLPPIPAKS